MSEIKAGDQDVTEAVQVLYDLAHASMDWGSGFLDTDEMRTVIQFAVTMGWTVPDLPPNSDAMIMLAKEFPDQYEIMPKDKRGRGKVRVR